MTPEGFHKVIKQQDREIREFKRDKQRQKETNTVFSKVITPQGAALKRSEESAVLYSYELIHRPPQGRFTRKQKGVRDVVHRTSRYPGT